jgi:BirA family transcriptional regulator, biotin operon repressor / biotin---[acetyl-CoA-carboxylase] ligase
MEVYKPYRMEAYGRYQIRYYSAIPSTNTLAVEKLSSEEIPEFSVYIADCQTAGRGRQGKVWFSKDKAGVWMSIVIRPILPLDLASKLTLVTSVAVRQALADLTGISPSIKWPNDIFYGNRKVCGILTEMQVREKQTYAGVIGIGINVNILPAEFPPEVQKLSTSLLAVTGKQWERDEVAKAVLDKFAQYYDRFLLERSFQPFYQEWMDHSYTIGKTVQLMHNRTPITGFAERMDADGCLWIRTETGEQIRIHSGEVVITF